MQPMKLHNLLAQGFRLAIWEDHHTSTQTKLWKCLDWVDADIYKLTVHQHTCVCHHLYLQSFMDIDLLLFRSQWDQTAKIVPKSPDFAMALTY